MNRYTDKCLISEEWLLRKIFTENQHQIQKWGIQTCTAFEWLTYAVEELGELAEAIAEYEYRNGSKKAVVNEAIQVATLTLKIAEMFDDEVQ